MNPLLSFHEQSSPGKGRWKMKTVCIHSILLKARNDWSVARQLCQLTGHQVLRNGQLQLWSHNFQHLPGLAALQEANIQSELPVAMPPGPSTIDSPKGSLYLSHLLQSPPICFCPLSLKCLPLLYKSLKSSKSRDGCDFVTTKFKALYVLWGPGGGEDLPLASEKKCLIKEVWRPFGSLQGLLLQLFPLMAGAHQYFTAAQTVGHQEHPEECPHQQWRKEASLLKAWHHAVAREV